MSVFPFTAELLSPFYERLTIIRAVVSAIVKQSSADQNYACF